MKRAREIKPNEKEAEGKPAAKEEEKVEVRQPLCVNCDSLNTRP